MTVRVSTEQLSNILEILKFLIPAYTFCAEKNLSFTDDSERPGFDNELKELNLLIEELSNILESSETDGCDLSIEHFLNLLVVYCKGTFATKKVVEGLSVQLGTSRLPTALSCFVESTLQQIQAYYHLAHLLTICKEILLQLRVQSTYWGGASGLGRDRLVLDRSGSMREAEPIDYGPLVGRSFCRPEMGWEWGWGFFGSSFIQKVVEPIQPVQSEVDECLQGTLSIPRPHTAAYRAMMANAVSKITREIPSREPNRGPNRVTNRGPERRNRFNRNSAQGTTRTSTTRRAAARGRKG